MGRKGMKGFLKLAKGGEASDDEQEAKPEHTAPKPKPAAATTPAPAAAAAPKHDSDSGSDDEGEHSGPETRGHMLQRHKREMAAHKKAVQKMGKKSKDEIAKLNKELEDRHARELAELEAREKLQQQGQEAALSQQLEDTHVDAKKPSKGQKRREKLAAAEAEREARIAAEQAALGPTSKAIEEERLVELLKPLGLRVREIRADGHCLYRSIEDQLTQQQQHRQDCGAASSSGAALDVQALRNLAAAHIRAHPDDFAAFMYDEDEQGDMAEQLEAYCERLESTAEWGGQLELGALAAALKRQIKVHAVGMPTVTLGDEHAATEGTLQLCYLRHAFGLGEHYNSVQPLGADDDDEQQDSGADAVKPEDDSKAEDTA